MIQENTTSFVQLNHILCALYCGRSGFMRKNDRSTKGYPTFPLAKRVKTMQFKYKNWAIQIWNKSKGFQINNNSNKLY